MHLIFEACDAGGKTSAIEELHKLLGWKVIKGSSFELAQCNSMELLKKFHDMSLDNYKENVIFDRFIYSNAVYADIYKDYTLLSDEVRSALEEDFPPNSKIVYLHADIETLTDRLNSRGDDYVKAEKIPLIIKKYNEVLTKVNENIEIIPINTSQRTPKEVAEYIVSIISK